MNKILVWLFWYSIANSVLDNIANKFGKTIATHVSKVITEQDEVRIYCPICGEKIILEKMDALTSDIADGKISISMHTACLYKMGLDVCGDCRQITPSDQMNIFHVCKDCKK